MPRNNIVLHAEDYQEKSIPWVCFSDSYPPHSVHVRLCYENKISDPESMAVGYFVLGTRAHPDQVHVIFGRFSGALITHWRPLFSDLSNWKIPEPKLKKIVKFINWCQ